MNTDVVIDGKRISDGERTFITFEAGPTHCGLNSAKQLTKLASEAGADAIKFQIFDPDELVADKSLMYSYEVLANKSTGETKTITEPLHDIFVRRHLKPEEWHELKSYADGLNISFFATIGDQAGLKLVQELKCPSVKIASADVNYTPWLKQLAALGVNLQLDTGNSTFGEIEQAVDLIRQHGESSLIIHNCPSGYPAHLDSINLRMLPTLKQIFQCPVAYSDHTPGAIMDVAAVALGANLVEKTITLDKATPSVEHIMSLEPDEMATFVETIRDVETALGSSRRVMSDEEKNKRLNVRRSTFLAADVEAGTLLKDAKVKFKRPGYGIAPDYYETLLECKLSRNLKAGSMLRLEDIG